MKKGYYSSLNNFKNLTTWRISPLTKYILAESTYPRQNHAIA